MPFDQAWLAAHEAKMAALRCEATRPAPLLVTFELPFLLRLPNRTNGRHWSAGHAYRKSLLEPVSAAVAPWRGCQPMQKARLDVTRWALKLCDGDNNVASCKPLIDLLLVRSKTHPSSLGLLVDDAPQHLELMVVCAKADHRDQQRTHVRLEAVV